jgi:transcriptional regulator with XRE-family HTH domain
MSLSARITAARQKKGLSQEALGKMLGVSRAAVAQWEGGQTVPAAERLIDLADKLNVRFEWLYWGREPMEGMEPGEVPAGYAWVSSLSLADADTGELSRGAPMLIPLDLINAELHGAPDDFAVMAMAGQSMEPLLPAGATLLIDLRHTKPTPPGAFALWDGSGLAVQWVRRVPGSKPPMLRLSSENPRFQTADIEPPCVRIVGRVVWFARRL